MTTRLFQSLLMTDFDGDPAEDPEDVIDAPLDGDGRYSVRVPALTQMLGDDSVPPYERLVACLALISWAVPVGYRTLISSAEAPEEAPWYGHSLDRRFSVDDTFAQMADALEASKFLSVPKGIEDLRIKALRSLIGIADRQLFESKLAFALDEETIPPLAADISAVVERGLQALADGQTPAFDLATQLADLVGALAPVDEAEAVRLGYLIVGVQHSVRTLVHLCAVPARGRAEASWKFGEYLRTLGGADVAEALDEALAQPRNAMRYRAAEARAIRSPVSRRSCRRLGCC